ncbi:hypothetical protein NMY22_g8052 [Coprinellus aureogranulatus]|nr:hypothetical protein NMY22_g8052 [Coprinellus aureogranulatus]
MRYSCPNRRQTRRPPLSPSLLLIGKGTVNRSLSSLNPRGASVLGGQKLKERWQTYDDNEGADEGGGDVDIKGDEYESGEGSEDEESDIEHESPESDEVSQARSFPPLLFPQLRFDSRLPRIPVTVRLTVR